jgi:hypothetical protein
MKFRNLRKGVLLFAAVALMPAAPAFSDEIAERLKLLKNEVAALEARQLEMEKEATAAALEMPTFTYRPSNGMMIEAADKSWAVRFGIESHFRMLFESGRDQVGRTNGEVFLRRFRPNFYYCINNCLWEMEAILDLDGFGTNSVFHRAAGHFHAEQISPWLPTVDFGGDVSSSIGVSRQGSSSVGTQAEYDLLTRNTFDDGTSGQGLIFNWDNRPLDSIGIPGRINRLQIGMLSGVQSGLDDTQRNTDKKDFNTYLGINPFSQLKNKWLSGLLFETGAWFCNNDDRAGVSSGCNQLRIRDLGNGGRQTLFDTGTASIGRGLATLIVPGISWEIGPYTLRAAGAFQRFADDGQTHGRKTGNMFLIGHELFLWSPKGFLTGSPNTPGSILLGTHFERTDVACGDRTRSGCANNVGTGSTSNFHRDRILLREWDLYYFVAPRISIGADILWSDASNLNNGVNQAAQNLNICKRNASGTGTTCRGGIGGDWTDAMLNFRWTF